MSTDFLFHPQLSSVFLYYLSEGLHLWVMERHLIRCYYQATKLLSSPMTHLQVHFLYLRDIPSFTFFHPLSMDFLFVEKCTLFSRSFPGRK